MNTLVFSPGTVSTWLTSMPCSRHIFISISPNMSSPTALIKDTGTSSRCRLSRMFLVTPPAPVKISAGWSVFSRIGRRLRP